MFHPASHYIGVDLGMPSEFTALAVLEAPQRGLTENEGPRVYSLRHLQRWAPGTGYPEMAQELGKRTSGWPFFGKAPLLLDHRARGGACKSR